MARLTQTQLNQISKTFEERTPDELLRWAKEIFGDRVAAISAMQHPNVATVFDLGVWKRPTLPV